MAWAARPKSHLLIGPGRTANRDRATVSLTLLILSRQKYVGDMLKDQRSKF